MPADASLSLHTHQSAAQVVELDDSDESTPPPHQFLLNGNVQDKIVSRKSHIDFLGCAPWPSPKEDERRSPLAASVIGTGEFGLEFLCNETNATERDFDRGLQSAPLSASQVHLLQQFTLDQLDAGAGAGSTVQQLSPDAFAPVVGSASHNEGGHEAHPQQLLRLSASSYSPQPMPRILARKRPRAAGRSSGARKPPISNTRSTPVKKSANKKRRRR